MLQFSLRGDILMNRLKELRKEKGLTQEELAKELKTTKLTISNWENEKYLIRADKAKIIANYFQVWPPYLLGDSNFRTEDRARRLAEANKRLNKSIDLRELLSKVRIPEMGNIEVNDEVISSLLPILDELSFLKLREDEILSMYLFSLRVSRIENIDDVLNYYAQKQHKLQVYYDQITNFNHDLSMDIAIEISFLTHDIYKICERYGKNPSKYIAKT